MAKSKRASVGHKVGKTPVGQNAVVQEALQVTWHGQTPDPGRQAHWYAVGSHQ